MDVQKKWKSHSSVIGFFLCAFFLTSCTTVTKRTTLSNIGLTPDASPSGINVRVINHFFNPKTLPYELPYSLEIDPSHPFVIRCEHNRVVRIPEKYKKVIVRFIGRSNGYIQAIEVKWVDWEDHVFRRYYFHSDIDRFIKTLSPVPVDTRKGFGLGDYINGCTDPLLISSVSAYPKVVNEFNFLGDFLQKVLYPQSPLKAFSFLYVSG
ncbi:MAG: hypothetical protein M1297_08440 [Nitrospirae bacterium]|jgi:hypothetical protein|nr:hypothetical protein [Nitrospirota bacterium]